MESVEYAMNDNKSKHKPYATPPGYVPPTLAEQWKYFYQKHSYYRYGYSAVILLGVVGYASSRLLDGQRASAASQDSESTETSK